MEQAILDLKGATCTSCAIGIEHMARRIDGVEHIEVDRGNGEISMEFDGNPATIEKIQGFVRAIGYDAIPRENSPSGIVSDLSVQSR